MLCKICDKELDSKKRQKSFCSYQCRDISYQRKKENACVQCNGIYICGNSSNRKFCSQNCVNEWKKEAYCGRKIEYIRVNCLQCNKEIERMPSKINSKNFCNKSCACRYKVDKMLKAPKNFMYKVTTKNNGEVFVRSKWEALYIKQYLEKNNFQWQYEPRVFVLSTGEKYIPDFYIKDLNQWVEIKGYDHGRESKFKGILFEKEYSVNYQFIDKDFLQNKLGFNLKPHYLNKIAKNDFVEIS